MACRKALLLAVVCGAALAAPTDEGYSYPEPVNGLYLPPPPDEGGPINPGGSSVYETGIKLPEPEPTTTTTTRRPYRPPSTRATTRRPRPTYRPRPTTTRATTTRRPRPTYRPRPTTTRATTTRRPTYRPVTTPKATYIPPNLIPDGSGPSGTGLRPPTTRRPVITTPAPAAGSKMMHMSRPYEFGYAVNDDTENNSFSQKETSDGMVITGEYRWEMPDGRTQIVTYLADWAKGYYADVRYE